MNGPIQAGGGAMPTGRSKTGVIVINGTEIAEFVAAEYPGASYKQRINAERTVEAFLTWRAEGQRAVATDSPAVMADISLTATILRYKAENYTLLANQIEAEERGDGGDFPVTFWPLIETIEKWAQPAEHLQEAILALELAVEDYEMGETPRIPAMMKAALGWMKADALRRAGA